jgi:hypothetical protein
MRRLRKWRAVVLAAILPLIPRLCLASGGLDTPEALDRKVSLEGLSGISLFFARTYNESLFLYAVYCTALMALVGIIIAYLTDIILKSIGMEVHKIEHKE